MLHLTRSPSAILAPQSYIRSLRRSQLLTRKKKKNQEKSQILKIFSHIKLVAVIACKQSNNHLWAERPETIDLEAG